MNLGKGTFNRTFGNNLYSTQTQRLDKEYGLENNFYDEKGFGNTLSDTDASKELIFHNRFSDTMTNTVQHESLNLNSLDKEFGDERKYVYKSHIKNINMVRPTRALSTKNSQKHKKLTEPSPKKNLEKETTYQRRVGASLISSKQMSVIDENST